MLKVDRNLNGGRNRAMLGNTKAGIKQIIMIIRGVCFVVPMNRASSQVKPRFVDRGFNLFGRDSGSARMFAGGELCLP